MDFEDYGVKYTLVDGFVMDDGSERQELDPTRYFVKDSGGTTSENESENQQDPKNDHRVGRSLTTVFHNPPEFSEPEETTAEPYSDTDHALSHLKNTQKSATKKNMSNQNNETNNSHDVKKRAVVPQQTSNRYKEPITSSDSTSSWNQKQQIRKEEEQQEQEQEQDKKKKKPHFASSHGTRATQELEFVVIDGIPDNEDANENKQEADDDGNLADDEDNMSENPQQQHQQILRRRESFELKPETETETKTETVSTTTTTTVATETKTEMQVFEEMVLKMKDSEKNELILKLKSENEELKGRIYKLNQQRRRSSIAIQNVADAAQKFQKISQREASVENEVEFVNQKKIEEDIAGLIQKQIEVAINVLTADPEFNNFDYFEMWNKSHGQLPKSNDSDYGKDGWKVFEEADLLANKKETGKDGEEMEDFLLEVVDNDNGNMFNVPKSDDNNEEQGGLKKRKKKLNVEKIDIKEEEQQMYLDFNKETMEDGGNDSLSEFSPAVRSPTWNKNKKKTKNRDGEETAPFNMDQIMQYPAADVLMNDDTRAFTNLDGLDVGVGKADESKRGRGVIQATINRETIDWNKTQSIGETKSDRIEEELQSEIEMRERINELSQKIEDLSKQNLALENSKMVMIEVTSTAMNDYRETIKTLVQRVNDLESRRGSWVVY